MPRKKKKKKTNKSSTVIQMDADEALCATTLPSVMSSVSSGGRAHHHHHQPVSISSSSASSTHSTNKEQKSVRMASHLQQGSEHSTTRRDDDVLSELSDSYSIVSNHQMKPLHSSYTTLIQRNNRDSISALQSTLVQCGKLQLADVLKNASIDSKLDKGIAIQSMGLLEHAHWFKGSGSEDNMMDEQTREQYRSMREEASTRSSAVSTSKLISSYKAHSSVVDGNSSSSSSSVKHSQSSIGGMSKKTAATKTTIGSSDDDSSSIQFPNARNSDNPFRRQMLTRPVISHTHSLLKAPNSLDPLSYKGEMAIFPAGRYNIAVKPSIAIGQVPSQSEVCNILESLTRKALLSFNARIVECGTTLRAMKDPRHVSPGLDAIFALHKAFVSAAATSPNNWLLNKHQIAQVLLSQVKWLDPSTVHRLMLSFDTQNTGLIRYVRISATLLCCLKPAMIELSTTLNRAFSKMKEKKKKKMMMKKKTGDEEEELDEEQSEYVGELVLIGFMHRLYEECAGSSVLRLKKTDRRDIIAKLAGMSGSKLAAMDRNYTAKKSSSSLKEEDDDEEEGDEEEDYEGVGMRLQDFVEAFSSCSTCIEDEVAISEVSQPVMQHLFDLHQQRSGIIATSIDEEEETEESHLSGDEAIRKSEEETHSSLDFSLDMDMGGGGNSNSPIDKEELERRRGPKLSYTYVNGEYSISTTSSTTCGDRGRKLLTHPLRTDRRGNSVHDLMNDPRSWRKKFKLPPPAPAPPPSSQHATTGTGTIVGSSSNMSIGSTLPTYPSSSSFLSGGNSVAWTDDMMSVSTTSTTRKMRQDDRSVQASMGTNRSSKSIIDVLHILKYGDLASIKSLPRISRDDLISAIKKHPSFLKEFIRQVRAFRQAAKPYLLFGSSSIEDSISQFNSST